MTSDTCLSNRHLIDALKDFKSITELRRSAAYRKHKAELDRLFNEPKIYEAKQARPRLRSFLRVVEWNVERGARLEAIVYVLNNHPVLRYADLLLLNELDCGMVRSGNLDTTLHLSRALDMHAVYAVEYLEFTKGVGQELSLPGENSAALHGNAILTRYKFSSPRLVRLPRCEDNFASAEKRLGGRVGLAVELETAQAALVAATAHLDVVNTPRCRARQMRALLDSLEPRPSRVIFGGDLNTHTFSRGGRIRAVANVAKVFSSSRERLARHLLRPEAKEPALRELERFGFDLASFNDRRATSRSLVSHASFPDTSRLPGPVRRWALDRIGPEGLLLEFRLDWIAARGITALKAGEATDEQTQVASIDPQTFTGLTYNGEPISDHDPIAVDVAL